MADKGRIGLRYRDEGGAYSRNRFFESHYHTIRQDLISLISCSTDLGKFNMPEGLFIFTIQLSEIIDRIGLKPLCR